MHVLVSECESVMKAYIWCFDTSICVMYLCL